MFSYTGLSPEQSTYLVKVNDDNDDDDVMFMMILLMVKSSCTDLYSILLVTMMLIMIIHTSLSFSHETKQSTSLSMMYIDNNDNSDIDKDDNVIDYVG